MYPRDPHTSGNGVLVRRMGLLPGGLWSWTCLVWTSDGAVMGTRLQSPTAPERMHVLIHLIETPHQWGIVRPPLPEPAAPPAT